MVLYLFIYLEHNILFAPFASFVLVRRSEAAEAVCPFKLMVTRLLFGSLSVAAAPLTFHRVPEGCPTFTIFKIYPTKYQIQIFIFISTFVY